jgi:hypothetical protein
MSTLILPSQYTHQAREKVEVDYSNPLAKDLIAAYNLTSFGSRYIKDSSAFGAYDGRKSSVGKYPYTLHGYFINGTTEVPLAYTSEGQVLDFNGTSSRRATSSAFPTPAAGGVVRTYITRVYLRDTTAKQIILGHFNSVLTPLHLYGSGLYVESGTLYGVGAYNNSKIITATAPSIDAWVTLALVTGVADGRIYIDGQLVASGDLVSTGVDYSFAIGCSRDAVYETGGAAFLNGMVGATLVYSRALVESEIQTLSTNPYQVLRSGENIWLDVVASGGDGLGSGDIASVALTTPTGTSSGSGNSSGNVGSVQLGNVSGSASAGTGGNASGSISQINIEAPVGASSGYANISSSVATATLSSPSGVASGGSEAQGSGSVATISLSVIAGNVSVDGFISGSISDCILLAPQGNASSGSSATGSGSIAQVNLTAATGSASAWASASGNLTVISLSAPTGNATVDATAYGSISLVSLSTVLGSASGTGAIVATGSIANVQLGIVNASVQSDSVVSSSIDSVALVAPTGTASTALTIVPRIIINLQAQQRYIKTKLDTRTISIKK